jgi:hypothetical protein
VAVLSVYVTPLYIVRVACAIFLKLPVWHKLPGNTPYGVHKKDLQKRREPVTIHRDNRSVGWLFLGCASIKSTGINPLNTLKKGDSF